jgi:alpha-L-fucosidase
MPTGEIDPRDADRLKRVGQWLETNGEAIYATRGGPYRPVKVLSASLLAGGEVTMTRTNGALSFKVDPKDRNPTMTVIKLTLEGAAEGIKPVTVPTN